MTKIEEISLSLVYFCLPEVFIEHSSTSMMIKIGLNLFAKNKQTESVKTYNVSLTTKSGNP